MIPKNMNMMMIAILIGLGSLTSGCAESAYVTPNENVDSSMPNQNLEPDVYVVPVTEPDMQRETMAGDLYLPPEQMQADASVEEIELTLSRCVDRMLDYLTNAWETVGCDQYTMAERSNGSSTYFETQVVSTCMKLECSGQPIEGHNGIFAKRHCRDLDDFIAALNLAADEANNGMCGTPTFRLGIMSLDEFISQGQMPCDSLVCGLESDGKVIAVDRRD